MKYNQATQNKIEKILDESEYVVRYERGTFQSGYCILEAKKVVVLNKFLSIEGRINTLVDLLPQLNINLDLLTHDSQKLYEELKKKAAVEAAAKQQAEEKGSNELFDIGNTTQEAEIEPNEEVAAAVRDTEKDEEQAQ